MIPHGSQVDSKTYKLFQNKYNNKIMDTIKESKKGYIDSWLYDKLYNVYNNIV